MRIKLVVPAVAVLVGVGVVAYLATRPSKASYKPHHEASTAAGAHGRGIDRAAAPALAMVDTPAAATPCESAYDAMAAEQATAKQTNKPSFFSWLAPREQFLAACQGLPAGVQSCMVPRYYMHHRVECDPIKPSDDVMKQLYTLAPPPQEGSPAEP